MKRKVSVVRFKFRCNILISGKIIKEMPGSVASGTHCIMLAPAVVVSTRLRKTLFEPDVKCSFTELIRKAALPGFAESTSPVANFIETHDSVHWSLTDVYYLRKGVLSLMHVL